MGPYHFKNNDAGNIKHAMQGNVEDIMNWLTDDDYIIVDIGYQDALTTLEDLGIKTEMPAFLPKGHAEAAHGRGGQFF